MKYQKKKKKEKRKGIQYINERERVIVTDKEIQHKEQRRDIEYGKRIQIKYFNNHHELEFYKIELNHFSYYFHTC